MFKALKLIRPHHYIKNGFIFLPAFFAGKARDTSLYIPLLLTFAAFSLVASGVYIFNDIRDRPEDQKHPEKKDRPLASGAITVGTATIMALFFLGAGSALALWINTNVLWVLILYIWLNILYSWGLKNWVLIDLYIIALGFILRLLAGSAATATPLSMWIFIMTFLLALFLAMAKRRSDYLLDRQGHATRKNIRGYNLPFINTSLGLLAGVTIVAYIMYTTSQAVIEKFHSENLFITGIFVLLGLLRYLQLTLVQEKSGSPTRILLKDFYLQATILAWIASFIFIIY